jgi:two-component system, chemotaxis family, protein-glutamate methylesterase/glutaminase
MSSAVAPATFKPTSGQDAIRLMVVDDAVVVRGLLARWIEAEAGLMLAASLRSGREAIEQIERANPDVIVLDVDMPDTDGITALPVLLAKKRDLVVIMASTLTRRNAEISLRALALGAADYIPKPETTRDITSSTSFRRELIDKIRVLGGRRKRLATPYAPSAPPSASSLPSARTAAAAAECRYVASPALVPAPAPAPAHVIKLRPFPPMPPRVLLIGSSTGGPQALNAVVGHIHGVIDLAPVLIVQHMPATFTTILAEHLARASGRVAREAVDGESVRAGQIYVAPGSRHMRVVRRDGIASIVLDDGPLVNFCKPAVDPLFSSAAEVWGGRNLAVVLTGMGSDGTRGAADIATAGGAVIAQDEATSVVWGMPGSAAHSGVCSAVLPLSDIAPRIVRLFSGGRP